MKFRFRESVILAKYFWGNLKQFSENFKTLAQNVAHFLPFLFGWRMYVRMYVQCIIFFLFIWVTIKFVPKNVGTMCHFLPFLFGWLYIKYVHKTLPCIYSISKYKRRRQDTITSVNPYHECCIVIYEKYILFCSILFSSICSWTSR